MPLLWGTRADALARLPGYTVSGSTAPSVTDVDAWIAEAEALLTTELQALGAATTYDSGSAAEAKLAWLAETYAVGMFKRAFASAGASAEVDAGQAEFDVFWGEVRDWRSNPTWAGASLGAGSRASDASLLTSHTTQAAASGVSYAPRFTMGEKW